MASEATESGGAAADDGAANPPPRMVVRDVIDYQIAEGPLKNTPLLFPGNGKNTVYKSILETVNLFIQQGYEPLGAFTHHLTPTSTQRRSQPSYSRYSQVMVKYGPPRYETPNTWKKAEEERAVVSRT